MSSPFYGNKVPGIKYPVFEQALGEGSDERTYSVDVNMWLKGRSLNGYQVTSVEPSNLTVDSVTDNEGVIYFKLSNGARGYQEIKIQLPTEGAAITRHFVVLVKPL